MNPATEKETLPMSSIGSIDAIVRAVDVRKSYGDFKALQGITLDIPKGEVLCVIGPSGSGKSTFLRCINQLEEINDGALWVNGERVGYRRVGNKLHALSEKQVARQRLATGMVFQRFNLFPHKTVLENVIEGPVQVLKRRRSEAIEEARALLERVGLAHKCDAFPVELSGGQQQRVAIALCSWIRGRWWRAARRNRCCRILSIDARRILFPLCCHDFFMRGSSVAGTQSDFYLQRVFMNVSLRLRQLAALVADGTYQKILVKWGLQEHAVQKALIDASN
jgi:ABC-type ATPase involved in cell division